MSSKKLLDQEPAFDSVLARAMSIVGAKTQTELAAALGLSTGDLSSRKKRGALPYDRLTALAISRNASIDWLLTGEGPMLRDGTPAPTPADSARNPREEALLQLFRDLDEDGQREIQQAAQAQKRLSALEQRIEELAAKVEGLEKTA